MGQDNLPSTPQSIYSSQFQLASSSGSPAEYIKQSTPVHLRPSVTPSVLQAQSQVPSPQGPISSDPDVQIISEKKTPVRNDSISLLSADENSSKPNPQTRPDPNKPLQRFEVSEELLAREKAWKDPKQKKRLINDEILATSNSKTGGDAKSTRSWMSREQKPKFSTDPETYRHAVEKDKYKCIHQSPLDSRIEDCIAIKCRHKCCKTGVDRMRCIKWIGILEERWQRDHPNYVPVHGVAALRAKVCAQKKLQAMKEATEQVHKPETTPSTQLADNSRPAEASSTGVQPQSANIESNVVPVPEENDASLKAQSEDDSDDDEDEGGGVPIEIEIFDPEADETTPERHPCTSSTSTATSFEPKSIVGQKRGREDSSTDEQHLPSKAAKISDPKESPDPRVSIPAPPQPMSLHAFVSMAQTIPTFQAPQPRPQTKPAQGNISTVAQSPANKGKKRAQVQKGKQTREQSREQAVKDQPQERKARRKSHREAIKARRQARERAQKQVAEQAVSLDDGDSDDEAMLAVFDPSFFGDDDVDAAELGEVDDTETGQIHIEIEDSKESTAPRTSVPTRSQPISLQEYSLAVPQTIPAPRGPQAQIRVSTVPQTPPSKGRKQALPDPGDGGSSAAPPAKKRKPDTPAVSTSAFDSNVDIDKILDDYRDSTLPNGFKCGHKVFSNRNQACLNGTCTGTTHTCCHQGLTRDAARKMLMNKRCSLRKKANGSKVGKRQPGGSKKTAQESSSSLAPVSCATSNPPNAFLAQGETVTSGQENLVAPKLVHEDDGGLEEDVLKVLEDIEAAEEADAGLEEAVHEGIAGDDAATEEVGTYTYESSSESEEE